MKEAGAALAMLGALAVGVLSFTVSSAARFGQPALQVPSGPLAFGMFIARFGSDGTFTLEGRGWPLPSRFDKKPK